MVLTLPLTGGLLYPHTTKSMKGASSMERIGDFAKRCQTTIKTLRYYDQLGLLVPDYIDAATQYRYYGANKMAEMRQITALKDIGFTLDEIKRYCQAAPDEQTKIIDEKHWALTKMAEDTAQRIIKLEKIRIANEAVGQNTTKEAVQEFVDDPRVMGRWAYIATVPTRESFNPAQVYENTTILEELYFLPEGRRYWSFGWTNGYLKVTSSPGDWLILPYELSEINGQTYMFVEDAAEGECWVLRQADTKAYTRDEIGEWDDINRPFIDDPAVHGWWTSVDFVDNMQDFVPGSPKVAYVWMKAMQFLPNGQVIKYEGDENAALLERKKTTTTAKWTSGTLLEAWENEETIAPAYTIHTINNADYLFFEWKSGDVIFGKLPPKYYVLKRGIIKGEV